MPIGNKIEISINQLDENFLREYYAVDSRSEFFYVFCYRDPDVGDSRLVRLDDLGDYPALIARGPLGQLLTNGIIDRYAEQQRDPAQKQSNAKVWLESLRAQVTVLSLDI